MNRFLKIVLHIVTGFFALTAIGGGIAILTGVDEFPPEWLDGTPFVDYTLPALILSIVVGGSSLLATVLLFRKGKVDLLISAAAGLIMIGFVTVELLILKQDPPGPTPIEMFYFALGLFVLACSLYLRKYQSKKK